MRSALIATAVIGLLAAFPARGGSGREGPTLGPVVARLVSRGGRFGGSPSRSVLRGLAPSFAVDAESDPPTVHVWMRLNGPGRDGVRGLGIEIESEVGDLASAVVPLPRLQALIGIPGIEWVQASHRRKLETDVSVPEIGSTAAASRYHARGAGVVVGIIDSGFDLTHDDLRRSDGTTRVKYFWNQTYDCGAPPPGFTYGCLYDESQINDYLGGLGLVQSPDAAGHGTHVAGTAAGNGLGTGNLQPAGRYVGAAPEADLVLVKHLPEPGAPSCGSCDDGDALVFIDERAASLQEPWVANMSFGDQFAAHDGFDPVEQVIDSVTGPGIPGKAVVKSAGNERGSGIHISGTLTTGASFDHLFEVPSYTPNPGTLNDAHLFNVWYTTGDNLTVTVFGPSWPGCPTCTLSKTTGSGQVYSISPDGLLLMDDFLSSNGSRFVWVQIDDQAGTAPRAGTWRVNVHGNTITAGGRYDAWTWRSSFGPSGEIAVWSSPDDSRVISVPGTAFHVTTVGAYVTKNEWVDIDGFTVGYNPAVTLGALTSFSSPGPTRDGRTKPEIAAPGQGIAAALAADAAPAVLANANLRHRVVQDGEHWVIGGTSFSAPHVTGVYAQMLGLNPTLDAVQLRTLLTRNAREDSFTGMLLPNRDWGFGKLDAERAIDDVVKPIDDLVAVAGGITFAFSAIPQATTYDVFRVPLSALDGTAYGICLEQDLFVPTFLDPDVPMVGDGFGYVVAGAQDGILGLLGFHSDGTIRPRPSCP